MAITREIVAQSKTSDRRRARRPVLLRPSEARFSALSGVRGSSI